MTIDDEIYKLESELRNDKVYNDRTGRKYGWAIKAENRLRELYYLRDNQQKMELDKHPMKTSVVATPIDVKEVQPPKMVDYQEPKFEQIDVFEYLNSIAVDTTYTNPRVADFQKWQSK